jgi:phosphatidylglycerophosphatase C
VILALFDFDGTITKSDSLVEFIRFFAGDVKTARGLAILSPMLIAYKLKFIPNYRAKQRILSYFFKGVDEKWFLRIAEEFSLKHIDKTLRPEAMKRVAWHKEQGHKVVIVSASIECWLKPWCEINGLDVIATKMEIKNGIITGKLSTKNCYGIEKANRVKDAYSLIEYDCIYAYGDTRGDKELLELANERL